MWPLSVLKYQTVLYPSNKEGGLKTSHGTAGHELAIRFNKFFTASLDLSRRSASADTSLHKTTSDVELLNSSLFLSDEDPRRSTQLLDFVRSHLSRNVHFTILRNTTQHNGCSLEFFTLHQISHYQLKECLKRHSK